MTTIGPAWAHAIANPTAPTLVQKPACQDIVLEGDAITGPGRGLEALPVPISTPGFDAAPYLTATCVVTRDPDTGAQNMGTYRLQLKSPTRLGMMMAVGTRPGGTNTGRNTRRATSACRSASSSAVRPSWR